MLINVDTTEQGESNIYIRVKRSEVGPHDDSKESTRAEKFFILKKVGQR
jgi:hypothetical protein